MKSSKSGFEPDVKRQSLSPDKNQIFSLGNLVEANRSYVKEMFTDHGCTCGLIIDDEDDVVGRRDGTLRILYRVLVGNDYEWFYDNEIRLLNP